MWKLKQRDQTQNELLNMLILRSRGVWELYTGHKYEWIWVDDVISLGASVHYSHKYSFTLWSYIIQLVIINYNTLIKCFRASSYRGSAYLMNIAGAWMNKPPPPLLMLLFVSQDFRWCEIKSFLALRTLIGLRIGFPFTCFCFTICNCK